jgi:leucyl/phenylalanyl-tRNA---protein transferase
MPVRDADGYAITPETVLSAYRARCFPMADERGGPIRWYRPEDRAVITWDRYKIPESLRKRAKQRPYHISVDRDFSAVIAACAERSTTWISHDVEALYTALHQQGHAHSLEAWAADGALVGGLYGLCIGGVFCGESMFHRADDAAKLCVIELVAILRRNGFAVLDCQQQTPHMERFGARVIHDAEYADLLAEAREARAFIATSV